ncbi:Olfactory receptor 1013 [Camelus dromedarius]|uniref:Olfactory receptor 1013 n=1 Tax=Camelus dromedarius TaxID=9838 RepID=A0A5N4C191_CAMDR|nr:Olfactory receptor 1013 [Camelus dromedarius]
MLQTLLSGPEVISFVGCVAQFYFFGSMAVVECFLLAAMSYDRYLAICSPLQYSSLMKLHTRFLLAVVTLYYGTLGTVYAIPTETQAASLNKISLLYTVVTPMVNPIVYSLRNKDVKNAWYLYYGNMGTVYAIPTETQAASLNKISLLYTVVTPMVNPPVYSLRNKDV